MDKLQLTGLNLGRVFNYRCGHAPTQIITCTSSKQPNLQLKTRPKQVLGYLPLAFVLPSYIYNFKNFRVRSPFLAQLLGMLRRGRQVPLSPRPYPSHSAFSNPYLKIYTIYTNVSPQIGSFKEDNIGLATMEQHVLDVNAGKQLP